MPFVLEDEPIAFSLTLILATLNVHRKTARVTRIVEIFKISW